MKVLVTGANGFVGRTIVDLLRQRGDTVLALVRPGHAMPVETREVTAWTEDALTKATAGAEAIIHAASLVHRRDALLADYVAFNVDGTNALLRAATKNRIERFVFVSSLKVYGEAPTGIIHEDTPLLADLPYAVTKRQSEAAVLAASRDFARGSAALRLAPVFGIGDKGNVRQMIKHASRRTLFVPGDGSTRKSLVHVGLVARACLAALDSNATGPFVVANRHAPSMGELADLISKLLGRHRPPRVPAWLLLGAARATDRLMHAARMKPLGAKGLVEKSQIPTVCDVSHLENTLGVDCNIDLDAVLREEVAWLKREGQIS